MSEIVAHWMALFPEHVPERHRTTGKGGNGEAKLFESRVQFFTRRSDFAIR